MKTCNIPPFEKKGQKYAYVFAQSPQNSFIIFPPNSSLKRPIYFLFLPIGSGLSSFSS